MQQTLGTRQQLNKLSAKELQLLGARVSFSGSASNLGVTIDSQLTISDHVISLCRSCFFQLRQLRQVRSSLTTETTETLVHASISSRLDYCNSLLYGINDGCSECRSSCHEKDQEVRPHHTRLTRTSLASGLQAHRLQPGGDGLQVSARTGATIPRSPRWRADDIFDLLCPAA